MSRSVFHWSLAWPGDQEPHTSCGYCSGLKTSLLLILKTAASLSLAARVCHGHVYRENTFGSYCTQAMQFGLSLKPCLGGSSESRVFPIEFWHKRKQVRLNVLSGLHLSTSAVRSAPGSSYGEDASPAWHVEDSQSARPLFYPQEMSLLKSLLSFVQVFNLFILTRKGKSHE